MSSQSPVPRGWRLSHFWRQVAIGLVVAYIVGATPFLPAFAHAAAEFIGGTIDSFTHPQGVAVDPQASPAPSQDSGRTETPSQAVSGTATEESSPTPARSGPAASAADLCEPGPTIKWTNHEPHFEPNLTVSSEPCDIVMVSSQTIDIPGAAPCLADVRHVCVLLIGASSEAHSFRVSGLHVSWWGTARTTIDAAIADKVNDRSSGWFSPANCRGGCDGAIVSILDADGTLVGTRTIPRP
jgi:hypothetical protein